MEALATRLGPCLIVTLMPNIARWGNSWCNRKYANVNAKSRSQYNRNIYNSLGVIFLSKGLTLRPPQEAFNYIALVTQADFLPTVALVKYYSNSVKVLI